MHLQLKQYSPGSKTPCTLVTFTVPHSTHVASQDRINRNGSEPYFTSLHTYVVGWSIGWYGCLYKLKPNVAYPSLHQCPQCWTWCEGPKWNCQSRSPSLLSPPLIRNTSFFIHLHVLCDLDLNWALREVEVVLLRNHTINFHLFSGGRGWGLQANLIFTYPVSTPHTLCRGSFIRLGASPWAYEMG